MVIEIRPYGKTRVFLCQDAQDLGITASKDVGDTLRELLKEHSEVRMILAAGESQMTFLDSLASQPGVLWSRIVCFNMDDFWDPRIPEQFTCGYQTRTQLYDKVRPKRFHLVRFNAQDPYQEAQRFESELRSAGPVHVLCQGIGTSGHLALNEPFQTDFHDASWARVVDIAEQ